MSNKLQNKKSQWTKPMKVIMWVCASLFLLIMIIAISTPDVPQKFDKNDHIDEAISSAEDFIKEELKAPATAQFSNEEVRYYGDSVYNVRVDVDAQNSFGALIRSKFYADVKLNVQGDFTSKEVGQINY